MPGDRRQSGFGPALIRRARERSRTAEPARPPRFAVARELARGELVEVLESERGGSRKFSLLYPKGVLQTPAVKKLIAFLVSQENREPR